VPLPSQPQPARVSIDGGADGLALARVVTRLAAEIGADLAITLGSYSSPREAARLLAAHGYEIASVTLSALRLGAHTIANASRVLELDASGEGPLLRTGDGPPHYVVMALSCRRAAAGGGRAGPSPDELLETIRHACRSRSVELEALNVLPGGWQIPIRILVLPDEPHRHHA
jgi:release factor glutamine methyltransferase